MRWLRGKGCVAARANHPQDYYVEGDVRVWFWKLVDWLLYWGHTARRRDWAKIWSHFAAYTGLGKSLEFLALSLTSLPGSGIVGPLTPTKPTRR